MDRLFEAFVEMQRAALDLERVFLPPTEEGEPVNDATTREDCALRTFDAPECPACRAAWWLTDGHDAYCQTPGCGRTSSLAAAVRLAHYQHRALGVDLAFVATLDAADGLAPLGYRDAARQIQTIVDAVRQGRYENAQ